MTQTASAIAPTARRTLITGVAFALGAAMAYGSSQVLTRQIIGNLAPPLVGTLISLFWGTLGFALLSVRNLGGRGDHSASPKKTRPAGAGRAEGGEDGGYSAAVFFAAGACLPIWAKNSSVCWK